MTIEQLKPADHDGVIGQIISTFNQIKYLKENVLNHLSEMQAWEAKEYRNMYHNYQIELTELQDYIKSNLSFWNEKLGLYHTSPAIFLNAFSI